MLHIMAPRSRLWPEGCSSPLAQLPRAPPAASTCPLRTGFGPVAALLCGAGGLSVLLDQPLRALGAPASETRSCPPHTKPSLCL